MFKVNNKDTKIVGERFKCVIPKLEDPEKQLDICLTQKYIGNFATPLQKKKKRPNFIPKKMPGASLSKMSH